MSDQLLFSLGIVLVFAGLIVAFVAVILMLLSSTRGKGKVKGGGAVIVGIFPIVFGTDRESLKIFLLLSIAIVVLMLVATVIFHLVLG